jgi:hypothetical protein
LIQAALEVQSTVTMILPHSVCPTDAEGNDEELALPGMVSTELMPATSINQDLSSNGSSNVSLFSSILNPWRRNSIGTQSLASQASFFSSIVSELQQCGTQSSDLYVLGAHSSIVQGELSLLDGENNSSNAVRRNLSKGMLVLVPLLVGFFPVGMKWAQQQSHSPNGFSKFGPLMVASCCSSVIVLFTLLVKFGQTAVIELCSARYIVMVPSGLFCGARFILESMAVTSINPTVCAVVMKSNLVQCLWLSAVLLRIIPSNVQCVTTFTVVGICVAYVLSSADGALEASTAGIVLTLVAGFMDALSDLSCEIGARYCETQAQETGENLRCLVVYLSSSAMAATIAFFVGESHYLHLEHGFFHGWTHHTVFGVVLVHAFRSPLFAASITSCGALATNLAASLDMIVVCFFELTLLSNGPIKLINVVLLTTLLLASVNYGLHGLALKASARTTLQSVQKKLDSLSSNILVTTESSQSKTQ